MGHRRDSQTIGISLPILLIGSFPTVVCIEKNEAPLFFETMDPAPRREYR